MLNCREVSRLYTSDEIQDLGWLKKIELRVHLALCHHCRQYMAQISAIGRIMQEIWTARSDDDATLERLENSILSSAFGGPGHPGHKDG